MTGSVDPARSGGALPAWFSRTLSELYRTPVEVVRRELRRQLEKLLHALPGMGDLLQEASPGPSAAAPQQPEARPRPQVRRLDQDLPLGDRSRPRR